jgi:hypothetical protein
MTEYIKALNEVDQYLTPAIGFSDYESQKEDSKIIIKQNNTIIQLLIQVLEKLDSVPIGKEIVLSSSEVVASSRNINSERWTYLKASIEETKTSSSSDKT